MTQSPDYSFSHHHLLSIGDLHRLDIDYLLGKAHYYHNASLAAPAHTHELEGKILVNLFAENSTRTLGSFEIAAKRLGCQVVNILPNASSIKKGETLLDTAATLNAMQPDLLVIRHSSSGVAKLLSRKVDCAVINAGDGMHEHPTQALLDALTILQHKSSLEGLKIAICGDIQHSRVARSNARLLHKMGAELRFIAPPSLMPTGVEDWGGQRYTNMRDGLNDCDVVMMLRLQTERILGANIPSSREYFHYFGLDQDKLSCAKPDALVMHPGPMNRGIEIDSSVADGVQSVITEQVQLGVAIRMAVLTALADGITHQQPESM